jgi:hypothetical protein
MVLTALLGLGAVVAAVGWDAALAGFREQFVWIRDHEKPWHLVARQSDLRGNNESLPVVLARTFGVLHGVKPQGQTVSLGLVPLDLLWATWVVILLVMAIVWLSCARFGPANESGTRRACLGMFALSSLLMLASTPICWHHYFLWLLPATLFLAHRPRLLGFASVVSMVGTVVPIIRGLGGHMVLALVLFVVVAIDLRRLTREPRHPLPVSTKVSSRSLRVWPKILGVVPRRAGRRPVAPR